MRGLYELGMEATQAYEEARETVARFIHAAKSREIVFTRNTTEALNLVAYKLCLFLSEGRGTRSWSASWNITAICWPWQMAAQRTGARLVFLEMRQPMAPFLRSRWTRPFPPGLVWLPSPMCPMCWGVRRRWPRWSDAPMSKGPVVVLDAAQSIAHMPVDVKGDGCGLYGFFWP